MASQNGQVFHDELVKTLNRFMARADMDLASIATDIRIQPAKFYNMVEARQKWSAVVLLRLYHLMKRMRDRPMAMKFLQALFDDDEISIPDAGDVIRDKICALMYRTIRAIEENELDPTTARAIATEAERFGATVKKKAKEQK